MARRELIIGGLAAAVRLVPIAWARAWTALAPALAVLTIALGLNLFAPGQAWRPAALAAALAALVIAQGALLRLALSTDGRQSAGPRLGLGECRLVAVWALSAVLMFVLGLLAFVVTLSFAFAIASAGHGFVTALPMTWARGVDERGRLVMGVVAAACLTGLIWVIIRIALAGPATAGRGRVQVLASWPLTRGLVLVILVARCLLWTAPLALAAVAVTLGARAPGAGPVLVWTGSALAAVLVAGVWLPLDTGLMAYLYRSRPPT